MAKKLLLHDVPMKPGISTKLTESRLRAYLIQSRGIDQAIQCATCYSGSEPFLGGECRIVPYGGSTMSKDACAADIWNNEGTKCNHSITYRAEIHQQKKTHAKVNALIKWRRQNPNAPLPDENRVIPKDNPYIRVPEGYKKLEEADYQLFPVAEPMLYNAAGFEAWVKENDMVADEDKVVDNGSASPARPYNQGPASNTFGSGTQSAISAPSAYAASQMPAFKLENNDDDES